MIDLEKPVSRPRHWNANIRTMDWIRSKAFAFSSRGGQLSHRVRHVDTYIRSDGGFLTGDVSHTTTIFWCGNFCHNTEFTDDPHYPVCARCEAMATKRRGLPTSEELVGRPVEIQTK